MLKLIKQWLNDWNDVQVELASLGVFHLCTMYGTYLHYIDPELSPHINTADDKSNPIQRSNKQP